MGVSAPSLHRESTDSDILGYVAMVVCAILKVRIFLLNASPTLQQFPSLLES